MSPRVAGPRWQWWYRCIIIIVTNSTLYLWRSGVLISLHPRFHLVPPQGLVQFSELYEKHTCLWLQRSYLKRKRPMITCGQDAILLRIPFVEPESLGRKEESASPPREEGGGGFQFCCRMVPFLQHHSLVSTVIKRQGGHMSSWFLAPRSTPNGNLEIHIWIQRTQATASPGISKVCLVSELP